MKTTNIQYDSKDTTNKTYHCGVKKENHKDILFSLLWLSYSYFLCLFKDRGKHSAGNTNWSLQELTLRDSSKEKSIELTISVTESAIDFEAVKEKSLSSSWIMCLISWACLWYHPSIRPPDLHSGFYCDSVIKHLLVHLRSGQLLHLLHVDFWVVFHTFFFQDSDNPDRFVV